MPTCKLCSKEYPAGAKFCGGCGSPTMAAAESRDELSDLFEIGGSSSAAQNDLFTVSSPSSPGGEVSSSDFDDLFPEAPQPTAGDGEQITDSSLEALFDGVGQGDAPHSGPSSPDLSDLFAEAGSAVNDSYPSDGADADLSDLFTAPTGSGTAGSPSASGSVDADLSDLFGDTASGDRSSPASLENIFDDARQAPDDGEPVAGSTEAEFARLSASYASQEEPQTDERPSGDGVTDVDGLFEDDDDEGEGSGSSRPRKSRKPAKKKRIRVVVVEKETWTKKIASFGLLVAVSLLAGLAVEPHLPMKVPFAWAGLAGALILVSLVFRTALSRVYRIHMTTQLAFLVVTVLTFMGHGVDGSSTEPVLMGIVPARLLVYVMLLVMAQGIYFSLFNRLLWSGFRLAMAILGVYGSITLFGAIFQPSSLFLDLARARNLPAPASTIGMGEALKVLFKAFEPLFVAVNVFLPALVIVAGLELFLHLWQKRWDKVLTVLLFLALFGTATWFDMRIYQQAGIENLKSLYGQVQKTLAKPDSTPTAKP